MNQSDALIAGALSNPSFRAWFSAAMCCFTEQDWCGAYWCARRSQKYTPDVPAHAIWMLDIIARSGMLMNVSHEVYASAYDALLRSPHDKNLSNTLRYFIETTLSAYGSFIPALEPYGAFARSVVEWGAGLYSTGLFLDRKRFPHLETLKSYENDFGWYLACQSWFGTDKRWTAIGANTDEVMRQSRADDRMYDLAFVDGIDRHECMQLALDHASVVALHDVEVPAVMEHTKLAKYTRVYKEHRPWTAICSNRQPV